MTILKCNIRKDRFSLTHFPSLSFVNIWLLACCLEKTDWKNDWYHCFPPQSYLDGPIRSFRDACWRLFFRLFFVSSLESVTLFSDSVLLRLLIKYVHTRWWMICIYMAFCFLYYVENFIIRRCSISRYVDHRRRSWSLGTQIQEYFQEACNW